MPHDRSSAAPTNRPAAAADRQKPRAALLAGIVALAGSGLLLSLTGVQGESAGSLGPPESAMSGYRPGGLELREAGRALAARARKIDGCLALTGFEAPRQGAAPASAGPLEQVLRVLAKSATARAIMRRASVRRVHVCLDAETDLLAYYFSGLGVIGVSERLSEGGRVAFLAHELSHVPQHPRYSDNRYYPAQDLLLLRRVREAAAEAMASRIAWELRTAGHPQAWEVKSAGPYADVTRAFATMARRDGSPEGLQAAMRVAFDRWFAARWRRNAYDGMTVDHLHRISGDDIGLVPPRRRLSERFLIGIANLDGGNFLAETQGPALTGAFYAGRLSSRNAGRLRRILQRASLPLPPGGETALAGAES